MAISEKDIQSVVAAVLREMNGSKTGSAPPILLRRGAPRNITVAV